MPDSTARIQIIINGKEHEVSVPYRGEIVIEIRHESQPTELSMRRIKNYKLHVKETGIHL